MRAFHLTLRDYCHNQSSMEGKKKKNTQKEWYVPERE